jgi:hypothetical protein
MTTPELKQRQHAIAFDNNHYVALAPKKNKIVAERMFVSQE